MEKYKDYWISGKAGLVHAFSPESYVAGAIYKEARGSSIVEIGRMKFPRFTMESQVLAARFGLELARMVVDAV